MNLCPDRGGKALVGGEGASGSGTKLDPYILNEAMLYYTFEPF